MAKTYSVPLCLFVVCLHMSLHAHSQESVRRDDTRVAETYAKRELLSLFPFLGFGSNITDNRSDSVESSKPASRNNRKSDPPKPVPKPDPEPDPKPTGSDITSSRPISLTWKSSVKINDNKKENQFQVGVGDGQMGMSQLAESALLRQTQKQAGKGYGRQSSKQTHTDGGTGTTHDTHVSQKQSQTLLGSLGFQSQSTVECNSKSLITHPMCLQHTLSKMTNNDHHARQNTHTNMQDSVIGRFKRFMP